MLIGLFILLIKIVASKNLKNKSNLTIILYLKVNIYLSHYTYPYIYIHRLFIIINENILSVSTDDKSIIIFFTLPLIQEKQVSW